ncbi:hypothetical protein ES703_19133 [subsurface metagenome]
MGTIEGIGIGRYNRKAAPGNKSRPLPQPPDGYIVHREDPRQGAPLGSHVGDGQAVVNRQVGYTAAGELKGVVENLVAVEQAAEGDDDVFAGAAWWQLAVQLDPGYRRNLPPGTSRGPDGGGVSTHHRRAQTSQAAVHVAVAVRGHHETARPGVALLAHDLVADAPPRRVEIDAHLTGKSLDVSVLLQVSLASILHVVIQGEYRLAGDSHFARADGPELAHHGAGVVVGHHVSGPDGDEVAAADFLPRLKVHRKMLGDFLDQGLGHAGPTP